jgi:hypothetical protein
MPRRTTGDSAGVPNAQRIDIIRAKPTASREAGCEGKLEFGAVVCFRYTPMVLDGCQDQNSLYHARWMKAVRTMAFRFRMLNTLATANPTMIV